MCVSFAILYIRLSLPSLQIPYICFSIPYWCFSFWLTSLCIIGSSFIHLIKTDSKVFFLTVEQYPIVHMYHNFLIDSSANGHLGCFHALDIVNSAVMNIRIHMSLSILVSLVFMLSSRIAGSYGSSFPWGWSWSLSWVQCHEPHSIVHQALYVSDLLPWIHCIIIRDLL